MMQKRTQWVGLLAVLVFVAGACGDDDGDGDASTSETTADTGDDGGTAPASETTADTGDDGGTVPTSETTDGGDAEECPGGQPSGELAFGIRNEPVGFDPIGPVATGSAGGSEVNAVFDTLMGYDPETGEVEPRMAESLEPNDDLTEWTLTLRDGVTFGSGASVDTAAVRFSVNRHKAPDSTSLQKPLASLIESMEIVDDLTMVFRLSSPWGNFPSLLASTPGMVIDPETFDELGAEEFAADPQGSGAGPYRLVRWAPEEEIVLEAKDDYWGGPVCIETLRFVRIEDNTARYEAFTQGEIDAAWIRSPQDAARAREDGINMAAQTQNGGLLLNINNSAGRPGEDLRVRQAIAYALDPEIIDERFTSGLGLPDSALVPESSVLYTDGIEGPQYDPERAGQLLEEVKADAGYDGSLHFLCNETYAEPAIAIAGMLEAVGFDVNNDSGRSVQDWVGIIIESPDYDITCHSLSMTDAQPWAKLELVIGGDGLPSSAAGYSNAEMDEAMNTLRDAATVEERQTALAEVQRVWNETIPSTVYAHIEEDVIWSDNVEGLEFSLESVVRFDNARITE